MDKNALPNYSQITIKQKDGLIVAWSLEYEILGPNGNIAWLAVEPKPVVGSLGGKRERLAGDRITRIEVKSDNTLFLDLSQD